MIRGILVILSLLALADGIFSLNAAESAFHQMIGLQSLAIAAILFTGAAVIDAIVNLIKKVDDVIEAKDPKSATPPQVAAPRPA